MANTDAKAPGTTGTNSSVGSVNWSNTDNVMVEDGSRAQANLVNNISYYLTATNFAFSLPAGAEITGIKLEVLSRGQQNVGDVLDYSMKLIKGGTISGDNKATGASLPLDYAFQTYGGSSDLWGITLTKDDIEASNFGVAISYCSTVAGFQRQPQVDFLRVTVYYSVPVADTGFLALL